MSFIRHSMLMLSHVLGRHKTDASENQTNKKSQPVLAGPQSHVGPDITIATTTALPASSLSASVGGTKVLKEEGAMEPSKEDMIESSKESTMEPSKESTMSQKKEDTTSPKQQDELLQNEDDDMSKANQPIFADFYYGMPRRTRRKHGDHWDILHSRTAWTAVQDEYGNHLLWYDDWVRANGDSLEEMLTRPGNPSALEKFANASRASLFDINWESEIAKIPLFKDTDTGDEYHIDRSRYVSLPYLKCPSDGEGYGCAEPLFLLHDLQKSQQHVDQEPKPKTPRHAISLGKLCVRTSGWRNLEVFGDEDDITEETDWSVILDADDEKFSVWIVVSRQQIKDHMIEEKDDTRPFPVFGGLMSTETVDYDCGCILYSVHRLGLDNPRRPDYSEVVDNILTSRRIIDGAHTSIPWEQKEKYIKGEPLDYVEPLAWPADPHLELKITALMPRERGITFGEAPTAPEDKTGETVA